MKNPKPPTTCPKCRAAMRRWALDYRAQKTPGDIRRSCLRIAKSYRNGWLACAPGEVHETRIRARSILD